MSNHKPHEIQAYTEADLKKPVQVNVRGMSDRVPDLEYFESPDKRQAVFLDSKNEGVLIRFYRNGTGVYKIGSDFSPARVAEVLKTSLPSRTFLELKESLEGTKIDLGFSRADRETLTVE